MFLNVCHVWLSIEGEAGRCVFICMYMCMYSCRFFVCKCAAQIYSRLPDCQTESVGGDIHRGAFSGTFMRDFFHG